MLQLATKIRWGLVQKLEYDKVTKLPLLFLNILDLRGCIVATI